MRAFLVGTAIGIVPGIVLVTWLGAGIFDLLTERWARWVLLASVVAFAVLRRVRRRRHVPT